MFNLGSRQPFEGDDDEDDLLDVPFIGRMKLLENLKNHITGKSYPKKRIIQLCGPPMIGKSRLGNRVLEELRREAVDRTVSNFFTSFIHMSDLLSLEPVKIKLAELFQFPDASIVNFAFSLQKHFLGDKTSCYVIVLDNCESMSYDQDLVNEFPVLVEELVRASRNVTVILTSSVQLSFPKINPDKKLLVAVPSLSPQESESLLKRVAPNVNLTDPETYRHCQEICELCFHYPFTVIFVGRLLQDEADLSPEDIITILKRESFEGLEEEIDAESNRPDGVLGRSFSRLRDELKRISAVCAYFPATFSEDAVRNISGSENMLSPMFKSKAIIPMKHRSILEYSDENKRYTMHSIVRDFFNRKMCQFHDLDITRRHSAKYFGELLINISMKLNNNPEHVVLKEMTYEWPNMEKLLREAIHCPDDDVYSVYMKVVHNAEHVIQKFMPRNGIAFFQALIDHANLLGNEDDKMVLIANLGNAMSNSTNYSHEESLELTETAYNYMINSGKDHSYWLKKLLAAKGWMYLQMGRTEEAEICQRQSLNIFTGDDERSINLEIKARNHLSQTTTFLGRYDESNDIIDENTALALRRSPYNHALNVMPNTKGLNYDRKGDKTTGLKYFKESLERRQNIQDITNTPVVPLNNVAKVEMEIGKYDECLRHLNRAISIQEEKGLTGPNLALTKRHLGRCHFALRNFQQSLAFYQQSHEIYRLSSPKHYELYGVELEMGVCHEQLGQKAEAIQIYEAIIDGRSDFQMDLSEDRGVVMKEVYERHIDLLDDAPTMQDERSVKMEAKFLEVVEFYDRLGDGVKSAMFRQCLLANKLARLDRLSARLLRTGNTRRLNFPLNIPVEADVRRENVYLREKLTDRRKNVADVNTMDRSEVVEMLAGYEDLDRLYRRTSPKQSALRGLHLQIAACHDALGEKEKAMDICIDIVQQRVEYNQDSLEDADIVMKDAFEKLVSLSADDPGSQEEHMMRMEKRFNGLADLHRHGNVVKSTLFRNSAYASQKRRLEILKERVYRESGDSMEVKEVMLNAQTNDLSRRNNETTK